MLKSKVPATLAHTLMRNSDDSEHLRSAEPQPTSPYDTAALLAAAAMFAPKPQGR
jgi:hypothetical protein